MSYIKRYANLIFAMLVMAILLANVIDNMYFKYIIFALAFILISYKTFINAFNTFFKRFRMSEQFLMSIATLGAIALKDLPEALAIMIFYQIGEAFEHYAQNRSKNEISSLLALRPTSVRLLKADGSESIVKPRAVKIGDKIVVLKGEMISLDGIVGEDIIVDTSAITGESEPVLYKKGTVVPSGVINCSDMVTIEVCKDYKNSSIKRLIELIEDAHINKSKPEALITKFASFYTPIVVLGAIILACVPLFVKEALFSDWAQRALVFLVISCPCALVLSVPLTFFSGLGAISKIGVLVKGSIYIEYLSNLKAIAFDKTGTITTGKFSIDKIEPVNISTENFFSLIYSLENKTTHPIAQALCKYAKEHGYSLYPVSMTQESVGYGISGIINDKRVYIGKYDYISSIVKIDDEHNLDSSLSYVYLADDEKYLGRVGLIDKPKDEALGLIKYLEKLKIKSFMITGDRKEVAQKIADELGIYKVYSQMLPEQKLNTYKAIKEEYKLVGFIGDGINDAPVIAASDVGISMGQYGSSSAIEASDVVIMNDDLTKLAKAIEICKRTFSLAIENIVLVIGVKALILIAGAFGYANIWLAILGDVGLLIIAVLNAMRAMRFK